MVLVYLSPPKLGNNITFYWNTTFKHTITVSSMVTVVAMGRGINNTASWSLKDSGTHDWVNLALVEFV